MGGAVIRRGAALAAPLPRHSAAGVRRDAVPPFAAPAAPQVRQSAASAANRRDRRGFPPGERDRRRQGAVPRGHAHACGYIPPGSLWPVGPELPLGVILTSARARRRRDHFDAVTIGSTVRRVCRFADRGVSLRGRVA